MAAFIPYIDTDIFCCCGASVAAAQIAPITRVGALSGIVAALAVNRHTAIVEAVEQTDTLADARVGAVARAGIVAVGKEVFDRTTDAIGVTTAHDAVKRCGGQLTNQLALGDTLHGYAQGFQRGVIITGIGVVDQ